MLRILVGKIHQRATRSALWDPNLGSVERSLERLTIVELEWDQQVGGARLSGAIPLREAGAEDGAILFVLCMLDEAVVASEQLTTADTQDHNTGIFAVARVANHITVAALDLEHNRRLLHLLEMTQRIAEFSCALKIETLRCVRHAIPHMTHDVAGAPVKKPHNLIDHRAVIVRGLISNARGLAALNEVIEARALWRFTREIIVTRTHGENALDHIQRAATSVYGPKYRAPSSCNRRVTMTRGNGSWTVTLMYGYDLSSRSAMLKRG